MKTNDWNIGDDDPTSRVQERNPLDLSKEPGQTDDWMHDWDDAHEIETPVALDLRTPKAGARTPPLPPTTTSPNLNTEVGDSIRPLRSSTPDGPSPFDITEGSSHQYPKPSTSRSQDSMERSVTHPFTKPSTCRKRARKPSPEKKVTKRMTRSEAARRKKDRKTTRSEPARRNKDGSFAALDDDVSTPSSSSEGGIFFYNFYKVYRAQTGWICSGCICLRFTLILT